MKKKRDPVTLEEIIDQQEKALDCAAEMRIKGSEYGQMGFKNLARYLEEQARRAEKWAINLIEKR